MKSICQLSRRSWLAHVVPGTVAVWTELAFGLGRKGWRIALGSEDLALGLAEAQSLGPAEALRVNMGFVNAYVLVRGKEIAIVDTGTPNNGARFAEVIRTAGLGWDAVRHVILTHYHPDHIGSMGEILTAAAGATAYAGAADIPQITSPRAIKAVGDNDEVFGLRIIATPGHTPGHICVLDPAGSLLILGDAMVNISSQLGGPMAQYTADMAQAQQSVKKLAHLTVRRAVFGHGDPIEADASRAIAKVAGAL
jgi:glyoxylase-like metal-dependent hydrolase (beta-lactamase superfamily II)